MLTALFRGFVSQSIWIVEPVGRKLVERRIWIWSSFVVYRQFEDAFPNANLRKTRERCGKQKEQHELPSHRFHLKGIDSPKRGPTALAATPELRCQAERLPH